MDRLRYDSAMFWLAFGTAAAVIGLALMTIGVTRTAPNQDLLASAWFAGGLVLLVVGAALLLWSLWLYLLHRRRSVKRETSSVAQISPRDARANAEAEAVKGYYREREKMLEKGMQIWERNERLRRRKPKR